MRCSVTARFKAMVDKPYITDNPETIIGWFYWSISPLIQFIVLFFYPIFATLES